MQSRPAAVVAADAETRCGVAAVAVVAAVVAVKHARCDGVAAGYVAVADTVVADDTVQRNSHGCCCQSTARALLIRRSTGCPCYAGADQRHHSPVDIALFARRLVVVEAAYCSDGCSDLEYSRCRQTQHSSAVDELLLDGHSTSNSVMPWFSVDAAYCLRKSEVEPFCSSSMPEELGRRRTAAPQNREGQYLCGRSSCNVASRCCADRSAGDATAAIADDEAVATTTACLVKR